MMTVETGLPGAGKTLYCVDKLMEPMTRATVKHEFPNGEIREIPRRIFSNINGLLIDHEKIGPGASWSYDGKGDRWLQEEGDKLGLNNWHEWAKPGDVIVFDEVQKVWPLAATGAKVPPCIEALETHRHMGVDFVLMTQHPMMIHVNITRLAGRHLHIRRLGNMGFSTVYEWDGVSRTLLYKNAMAKFPYRFGKKAFALYKSAEVHTKQPRKLPSLIFGVLFALVALAFFGPTVAGRLKDRLNPPSAEEMAARAPKTTLAAVPAPAQSPVSAPVVPVVPITQVENRTKAAGCISSANRCTCYETSGAIVPTNEESCKAGSVRSGLLIYAQTGNGL